jgi:hypothetical protein
MKDQRIDMQDGLVILCCLLSGLTLGVLVLRVKSFGSYTARIERASELNRQSNELTRQSNMRTIDEMRTNAAINELTLERTEAIFRAMQEALNNERSA